MIDEIIKKRWYLHNRQTKVISVAGYPEFMNDIYISAFSDFKEPRFLTVSGQLVKADPRVKDQIEYALGQYIVELHNDKLKNPNFKVEVSDTIDEKQISQTPIVPIEPKPEGKRKRQPTPAMLAYWQSKKGKQPKQLFGKPNIHVQEETIKKTDSQSDGPIAPQIEQSLQTESGQVQEVIQSTPQTSKEGGGLFQ